MSMKPYAVPVALAVLFSPLAQAATLKVAVVAPFSGPKSVIGIELKRGAEMAVASRIESFRAAGHYLSLVTLDDQANPTRAGYIGNALKVQPNILGMVGALNSGVTGALGDQLAHNPVALISPTSTNNTLTAKGWHFFSRVVAPDKIQAKAVAAYILPLKPQRMFVVSDNTTYGNGLSENVQRELKASGFRSMEYAGGSTDNELASLVQRVARSQPDLLYFGGTDVVAAKFLNALRAAGLTVPFIAGDGIYSKAFTDAVGKNAAGVVFTSPYPLAESLNPAFFQAYKAKYGAVPNPRAAFAYDAMNILLDAIAEKSAGGRGASHADVIAAVRSHKACVPAPAKVCEVTGPIAFTSSGERTQSSVYLMRYKPDGSVEALRTVAVTQQ